MHACRFFRGRAGSERLLVFPFFFFFVQHVIVHHTSDFAILTTVYTITVTRAVFWAWNSSSIQLINYFGLEGLVGPFNL